jgi:hypothetical protein
VNCGFSLKTAHRANFHIMTHIREWRLSQIALAEVLGRLRIELLLRNIIIDIADQVNFQTPYPLEPETAAAVDMAIRNHVTTWEALEDEGVIQEWLWDYMVDKEAKALPVNSYSYPDGKYSTTVTHENEKEVRACFADDAQFELFRSGKDYTHGLAGITDAEYHEHYGTIVNAMQELVKSGQVQEGSIIHYEWCPIPFLQDAPLVQGQWIDQRMVELAECYR